MARGRPPKPKGINDLNGDPGKRRRNTVEPTLPPETPEPPPTLDDVSRAEWDYIVPLMSQMGVLTRIDRSALIAYCEAWSRYRRVCDEVIKYGFEDLDGKATAAARLVKAYGQEVLRYLVEFGMTPAGRARMRIVLPTKGEKKKSKWGSTLPTSKG